MPLLEIKVIRASNREKKSTKCFSYEMSRLILFEWNGCYGIWMLNVFVRALFAIHSKIVHYFNNRNSLKFNEFPFKSAQKQMLVSEFWAIGTFVRMLYMPLNKLNSVHLKCTWIYDGKCCLVSFIWVFVFEIWLTRISWIIKVTSRDWWCKPLLISYIPMK